MRREAVLEYRAALMPFLFSQAHGAHDVRIEDFMPSVMGVQQPKATGKELLAKFMSIPGAMVIHRK